MKYLQSPNRTNAYGLYGNEVGPGHLIAIIEFEPSPSGESASPTPGVLQGSSADGDKLIRLLAAAPALLAALEKIAAGNPAKPGEWLTDIEMADIARAAIAQVREES